MMFMAAQPRGETGDAYDCQNKICLEQLLGPGAQADDRRRQSRNADLVIAMKPKSKAAQQRAVKNVGASMVVGVAHLNGQRVPLRDKPPPSKVSALLSRFNHK